MEGIGNFKPETGQTLQFSTMVKFAFYRIANLRAPSQLVPEEVPEFKLVGLHGDTTFGFLTTTAAVLGTVVMLVDPAAAAGSSAHAAVCWDRTEGLSLLLPCPSLVCAPLVKASSSLFRRLSNLLSKPPCLNSICTCQPSLRYQRGLKKEESRKYFWAVRSLMLVYIYKCFQVIQ